MADAVAKFAVALEDFVSSGANKAKASVDRLSSSLSKAKSELSGYKSQLTLAKQLGDVEGYRKYSDLVSQSSQKVFGLGQQLEGASSQLAAGEAEAGAMAASLGLVVAGAAAAAAGLYALGVIVEGLTVKALEVVNANQRMAASFEALGAQGAGSGKKTLVMLDELSGKLPQSREQLAEWTKKLEAMGITDLSKIRSELIATASAQAIMGDEGAAAYQKIQERVRLAVEAHHGLKLPEKSLKALYSAGVNVSDMARRMGMSTGELTAKLKAGTIDAQKFGDALTNSVKAKGRGPLDVMMNSIDVLRHKAGETISHLFDDIDTKPLTDALRNLIALGDQGEPSGQALKKGLTGAMNAIIRLIGHGITEAEVFFLQIEVKALQAYIALKPLIGAVEKISGAFGKIGAIGTSIDQGLGAPTGTSRGAAVDAGLEVAKSTVESFTGPIFTIPGIFLDVITGLGDAKAQELAHQQGLQIGQATIAGIREGTQTHSPSIEAIRIGMGLAEGLGMGMEGSPAPERAARTVSANALGGLAGGAAGAFGGAPANGNGSTSNVFNIAITAPEGVTDAHAISVAGLAAVLERYQIASGR